MSLSATLCRTGAAPARWTSRTRVRVEAWLKRYRSPIEIDFRWPDWRSRRSGSSEARSCPCEHGLRRLLRVADCRRGLLTPSGGMLTVRVPEGHLHPTNLPWVVPHLPGEARRSRGSAAGPRRRSVAPGLHARVEAGNRSLLLEPVASRKESAKNGMAARLESSSTRSFLMVNFRRPWEILYQPHLPGFMMCSSTGRTRYASTVGCDCVCPFASSASRRGATTKLNAFEVGSCRPAPHRPTSTRLANVVSQVRPRASRARDQRRGQLCARVGTHATRRRRGAICRRRADHVAFFRGAIREKPLTGVRSDGPVCVAPRVRGRPVERLGTSPLVPGDSRRFDGTSRSCPTMAPRSSRSSSANRSGAVLSRGIDVAPRNSETLANSHCRHQTEPGFRATTGVRLARTKIEPRRSHPSPPTAASVEPLSASFETPLPGD